MFVLFPFLVLIAFSIPVIRSVLHDLIEQEFNNPDQPWNYPLLPTHSMVETFRLKNELNVSIHSISKNVWMTLKEIPEKLPENIAKLITMNKDWQFHLLDDEAATEFMNDHFTNTSILWAYNLINPALGASKADIWRISALWLYGGCYIDTDSFLRTPFSAVVEDNDEIILGTERNEYRNHFQANLSLSIVNHNASRFFKNQIVINWLMFSRPQQPFLFRYLTNLIYILKLQYFQLEVFPNPRVYHSWQRLIFTTGPGLFTASVYQEVDNYLSNPSVQIITIYNSSFSSSSSSLIATTTTTTTDYFRENHKLVTDNSSIVFRYVGTDFHHYGGVFKYFSRATYKNASESHYIAKMSKGADLFLHYFIAEPKIPTNLRIWKKIVGSTVSTEEQKLNRYRSNSNRK
jgi:hypothetical protein